MGFDARSRIAAIDASTGLATAWDPSADGAVNALATDGSTVYAGGAFANIGGQPRSRIAAIAAGGSGTATGWDPSADGNVHALALSGTDVYAGGEFANIGGQPRIRIAAIDAGSNSATAWDPGADGTVSAIALGGSNVYLGGSFLNAGGQARNRIAAIPTGSNSATSWNPNADAAVLSLLVDGAVYAGGSFATIGGQTRNRIASLSTATGLATDWNPNADGDVRTIAVDATNLYAGGAFANVGGVAAMGEAAITRALFYTLNVATVGSGSVSRMPDQASYAEGSMVTLTPAPATGWSFIGWSGDASGNANPLVVTMDANKAITATFADTTRPAVTVVDPNGGETIDIGSQTKLSWTASDGVGVTTVDLELSRSGNGGPYETIVTGIANSGTYTWEATGPATTTAVLQVVAHDAAANAGADYSDAVFTLRLVPTYTLTVNVVGNGSVDRNPNQGSYAEGSMVTLTPMPNGGWSFIGWSGDASGNANPLVVTMDANKTITATFSDITVPATAVVSPSGGEFYDIGSEAALTWSAADGKGITSVDLLISRSGAGGPFSAIATSIANTGSYNWTVTGPTTANAFLKVIARDPSNNSSEDVSDAAFAIETAPPAVDPVPWITNPASYYQDGWVDATVVSGNTLYLGGKFRQVGPNTGGFVRVHRTSSALVPAASRVEGLVNAAVPDGAGGWYVGGVFGAVSGVARQNLARIRADGTLADWNPGTDGEVKALLLRNGIVYVGGTFTQLGYQARTNIGAVDAANGLTTPWNPSPDFGMINALATSGTTIYAGGIFNSIGGQPRASAAGLNVTTGLATPWDPNLGFSQVRALVVSGSRVYIGGTGGAAFLFAVDATTGAFAGWNAMPGGGAETVNTIAVSGSTVYAGGSFANIGGRAAHRNCRARCIDGPGHVMESRRRPPGVRARRGWQPGLRRRHVPDDWRPISRRPRRARRYHRFGGRVGSAADGRQ